MAHVVSFHSGKSAPVRGKAGKWSAIGKARVPGPVELNAAGISGDQQVDRRYHGGAFKALCVVASEYYPFCAEWTGESLSSGSWGENLSTAGLLDHEVCVGDLLTMGSVRMEVTGPRGPCSTFSSHWGSKDLHLEIKRRRTTGFYVRVVEPGRAAEGDSIRLVSRPFPRWTLPRFWDVYDRVERPAPAELAEFLELPALDPMLRKPLQAYLAALS